MTILFDTSVLVAALSARHPEHAPSFEPFQNVIAGKVKGCFSTHALAELYSVMTGHPSWRISPSDMEQVINQLLRSFDVVSLSSRDYQVALSRLTKLSIPGGGIYDALHAQAALKSKADVLLTLNKKHFLRLGADITKLVKEP
jgi:predicted nucleic acid-binding protein